MEFGAVGLMGFEHRIDDAGQFVSDGGDRRSAAEAGAHAAVIVTELIFAVME